VPGPEERLKVGDRVCLNERGRRRFKTDLSRHGTVISISPAKTAYRIRWDNYAVADLLHWSYVTRETMM
jgi:hypothetical protein